MNTTDMDPLTVTVPTACQVTGLGRTKLYELIASGALKSTTIGTRRLVDYASVKALLAGEGK
jgi:excisionase family DNA binding protein